MVKGAKPTIKASAHNCTECEKLVAMIEIISWVARA